MCDGPLLAARPASMDERQALVELIPRLRRYARSLAGNREAADDLVQDTLERALNKAHLFANGTDLRAWLFTVMHNAYVDQVRGAYRGAPLDEDLEDVGQGLPQTEQLALRDLERAIARLPEEQRSVLLLVCMEGLSYDEVARVLAVPVGTVMSRLSRARERIRVLMEGGTHATLKVVK